MLDWHGLFGYFQDNYLLIITSIIIIELGYYIYRCVQPFDKVFRCYDPRYGPEQDIYVEHQLGSLPTIYPYGWVPILESRDLKKRHVLAVNLYDEHLVVYRDASGEVHVFDAYCPHLGANIGIGGTVEGSDRLRCPFHGWTFNTDGQCVAVPGLDKDNLPKATLKKWVSAEKSRMIWIWRHPDGREPKWPCVNMPNVDEDKLKLLGRNELTLMMAIQDFGENVFDYRHFDTIHSDIKPLNNYPLQKGFWIDMLRKIIKIEWDVAKFSFTYPTFNTPLLNIIIPPGKYYFMGIELPVETFTLTADITSPYSVLSSYQAKGLSLLFHVILLPMPSGKVRLIENFYSTEYSLVNRFTASFLAFFESLTIQQDSPIWQNKLYLTKPHLTKLDSGITVWRRWLSQFDGKTNNIENES